MSGVDNMIYMYSVNANNGQMTLRVDFDINTKPNDDQILTQMRYTAGRIPAAARCQELRRHDQEIHDQPAGPLLALLAERHLRRDVLGATTPTSTSTIR